MSLKESKARKNSLAIHLKHRDWVPTPYISFTASASKLEELAISRIEYSSRGEQTVTVIDPDIRIRNGLPVLEVIAEMRHYSIDDPYGRGYHYYLDHYVCLWEVTAEEIVGHWDWNYLVKCEDWYEQIIMPAFKEFRKARNPAPTLAPALDPTLVSTSTLDMSALLEVLPDKSPDHATCAQPTDKNASKVTGTGTVWLEDEDESLEVPVDTGNSDSDNDTEEANWRGNVIKAIKRL